VLTVAAVLRHLRAWDAGQQLPGRLPPPRAGQEDLPSPGGDEAARPPDDQVPAVVGAVGLALLKLVPAAEGCHLAQVDAAWFGHGTSSMMMHVCCSGPR